MSDDHKGTWAPLPFVFCFPGFPVPAHGSAVRDGTFYIDGKVAGRCMSMAFQGEDGVWINYRPEQ